MDALVPASAFAALAFWLGCALQAPAWAEGTLAAAPMAHRLGAAEVLDAAHVLETAQDTPSASSSAQATAAIPVGAGRLELDFDGTRLEVFTYKPKDWKGERILFVMHGVLRNAAEYRDHATGMGDRFGALVVAPLFDEKRFPSRKYQRGGILNEDGTAAKPEEWTYAFVPKLAARVREIESKPAAKLWIIGHSAGGQFVMRMSAFQATGAERLVAANPGSDLFPTRAWKFGYGFGGLPESLADDARLKAYLAAPLTLYLGTEDDKPDENLDVTADGNLQGLGRLQRGRAAFEAGKKLATERTWPFAWRIVEAEGVGHDHEKMFAHASCEVALLGTETQAGKTPADRSTPK